MDETNWDDGVARRNPTVLSLFGSDRGTTVGRAVLG